MDKKERESLRNKVLAECRSILEQRIKASEKAMKDAQESANSEEKSSAGDKFETGRAMSHRERDMIARQVSEANKELKALGVIEAQAAPTQVSNGAMFMSGTEIYFIGAALGKVSNGELSFIALSLSSPLGLALKGKKQGEKIPFNGRTIEIGELF